MNETEQQIVNMLWRSIDSHLLRNVSDAAVAQALQAQVAVQVAIVRAIERGEHR